MSTVETSDGWSMYNSLRLKHTVGGITELSIPGFSTTLVLV